MRLDIYRLTFLCCLALGVAGPAARAQPAQVDTEHMFGFSEGSDIGKRGETELEIETIGRFGRDAAGYSAITTNAELKHVLTDRFRFSGALALARYDVSGLADGSDQNRFVVERISSELRFHMLDRQTQPIGLTFIATPFLGFVDPSTGEAADRYGASFIVAADRALVPDRVFGALNLGYALEQGHIRSTGQDATGSTLSFNAAAAARVRPWFYLGAEVRYVRAYDGAGLDALSGQAVYLGPVFYLPVANGISVSGAWNIQGWGQAVGVGGGLDLTNFERNQIKLRLSINL